jgi:hypothetical protein
MIQRVQECLGIHEEEEKKQFPKHLDSFGMSVALVGYVYSQYLSLLISCNACDLWTLRWAALCSLASASCVCCWMVDGDSFMKNSADREGGAKETKGERICLLDWEMNETFEVLSNQTQRVCMQRSRRLDPPPALFITVL